MHRGLGAETGHERDVERVLAEQVIEHLERGGVVFFLAGEVVGMQQPDALVRGYGVRAPHEVVFRHHDAETFLRAVHELVCRAQNFLLGIARVAEHGSVRRLAIGRDSLHVAPVRDVLRNARLLVRAVARSNREFRSREELFVGSVRTLVIAGRDVGGVRRKVHVHVVAAPGIGLLRRFQALARIARIEGLVHARSHGHHAREVECGLGALADNVKLGVVLRGHHVAREPEGSELVVHAAVVCLHGVHPVQVPLDFGKQVREGAICRDVPLEALEVIREVLVQRKQRVGGNARVHDVTTVVAGIVPALARIDGARTSGIMEFHRGVRMARRTCPLARIARLEGHGGALVVEPLGGPLEHGLESIVGNLQVLTEGAPAHLDGIGSRGLQVRKVHELHILPARIPVGGLLRGHLEGGLARGIHKLDIAVSPDKSEFLRVGRAEPHLVYVGICSKSRRYAGGSDRRKRDPLDIIHFQNSPLLRKKVPCTRD